MAHRQPEWDFTVYQWMHLSQFEIIETKIGRLAAVATHSNLNAIKCLQLQLPPPTLQFRGFHSNNISIINISVPDKCWCICLHQYLCIFVLELNVRSRASLISRSGFNYRCTFKRTCFIFPSNYPRALQCKTLKILSVKFRSDIRDSSISFRMGSLCES